MTIYNLVKDDTQPQFQITCTRSDTGAVIDLTGATVRAYFRKKGTDTVLFTMNGVNSGTNFQNGIVIFNFSSGQLNLPEAYYEAEIEITHQTGGIETIFETLDFFVREDFN